MKNMKDDDSTKEINLNDLYDGRINSTIIMDPVTKDEVLIKENKKNIFIYFFIILIIIFLLGYFLYFNTDLIRKNPEVKPVVTTTNKKNEDKNEINGDLNCSYSSKNDFEEIKSNIKFNIKNSKIMNLNFTLNVITNAEELSFNAKNMLESYENLYINNVSILSKDSLFEKNEKNFSLSMNLDYTSNSFYDFKIDDDTELLLKPSLDDSYYSLSDKYVNLGYSCVLTRNSNSN